jgi:hypothetical protein
MLSADDNPEMGNQGTWEKGDDVHALGRGPGTRS